MSGRVPAPGMPATLGGWAVVMLVVLALAPRLLVTWELPLAASSDHPECAPDEGLQYWTVMRYAEGDVATWPASGSIYSAFPPLPYALACRDAGASPARARRRMAGTLSDVMAAPAALCGGAPRRGAARGAYGDARGLGGRGVDRITPTRARERRGRGALSAARLRERLRERRRVHRGRGDDLVARAGALGGRGEGHAGTGWSEPPPVWSCSASPTAMRRSFRPSPGSWRRAGAELSSAASSRAR